MSERCRFIEAWLAQRESIVALCAQFGISEKTGHKFLRRFRESGPAGLAERSHAAHTRPQRVPPARVERILALRRAHPLYGPALLRDWLRLHEPEVPWPAASTIGVLLTRAGLVAPRRRRRDPLAARLLTERTAATAPNRVWTADFKGEFVVGTGARAPYCYPLTVLDLHSHFLLGCVALASTRVTSTRARFETLFRTYGLPDVLRTDNGVPFAHPQALGRLGRLAFWWVRLGIRPEHTPPGCPAANGAHERFHRTLKAHTAQPPAASLEAQQRRFTAFQQEYNRERPHTSVPAHRPPAALYTPSLRPYPTRRPTLEYATGTLVRRVAGDGHIKVHGTRLFLSTCLAGEPVGLTQRADGQLTIAYGALALGEFDLAQQRFHPQVRWYAPTPVAEEPPPR
jgi:transposase InsO family protein